MRIVVLTSDIIDGLIISEKIVLSGKDVKAVFYEKKAETLKGLVKRALYALTGKIKSTSYEGLKKFRDLGIYPVEDINSPEVEGELKKIDPDIIVVAGTRKLKKEIFGSSRIGAVNMHSGILPYYRGADSEFWALYNGEKEKIGVSIHFINEGLDTGDVMLTARQVVRCGDDHRSLRKKNIFLGAKKMVEAIELIEKGEYRRVPQDNSMAKTYKSATKLDLARYREKARGNRREAIGKRELKRLKTKD